MDSKALLTEKDIAILENRFKEIFLTKEEFQEHRSELFDRLDAILKEILAGREEQTVIARRISGHEDRIEALEEPHPF